MTGSYIKYDTGLKQVKGSTFISKAAILGNTTKQSLLNDSLWNEFPDF